MKKTRLLAIGGCLAIMGGMTLTSCNTGNQNGGGVTVEKFVDALVANKGLTPQDGSYVYSDTFVDHAVQYNYSLTMTGSTAFGYTLKSVCEKEYSEDYTGTVNSTIDFIWGRFKSSAFTCYGDLKNSANKEDKTEYRFYGIYFNDDGTILNSCNTIKVTGYGSGFGGANIADTGWAMTVLQVAHLSALTQEISGIYPW